MTESNAGQRKMARRLRATTGGMHGASGWRDEQKRKLEKQFGRDLPGAMRHGADRIARAIKKRLKTREERAVRKEQA